MKKKIKIVSVVIIGLIIVIGTSIILFRKDKSKEVSINLSDSFKKKEYDNFTDLGNNVIYFLQEDDVFLEANKLISETYDGYKNNCTSFVNMNSKGELVIGRNNDNEVSNYPVYVFENTSGKYKTFNIYYAADGIYTYDEIIESKHLNDDTRKRITYLATDVMNEEGLYIENNMRTAGSDGIDNSGTNDGKERVVTQSIPSLIGQNCKTVEEAIKYLEDSFDYYTLNSLSMPWVNGWDAGFLIADATGEYGVIEIANNKVHYTSKANINANFYLDSELSKADTFSCGEGRYNNLVGKTNSVETIDDAMKLIETSSWYHELLDAEYSYKDESGVHFVKEDGSASYDYRDELTGSLLVDESGNILESTKYTEGYYKYLRYMMEGNIEQAKPYKEAYEKENEYYFRCTSEYLKDDSRFDTIREIFINEFVEEKELLKEYMYNNNYYPAMEHGEVYTTGVRVGANTTTKEMKLQIFERDDLIIDYKFN